MTSILRKHENFPQDLGRAFLDVTATYGSQPDGTPTYAMIVALEPSSIGGGGGSGGGTSMADEAAFTEGTTQFTPIGGEFKTSPTALTTGQAGVASLTAHRAIMVNLQTAAGAEIGTSGSPVRVDPTGTTTQPVSGTFWQTTQPVSIAATVTVTGTVTANIGTTNGLALDATLTGGSQQVQGNIASGATDSGNPVKVGGVQHTTLPTLTDGQRGDLQVTTHGSLLVTLMGNNSTTPLSTATDADAVTAGGAQNLQVLAHTLGYNGTTWDRMRGDTTNGLWVNVKNSATVTVTGTVTANQGGSPWNQVVVAATSGSGLSTESIVSAASTNGTNFKASAGQLYGWALFNNGASAAYVKLYNKATAPTVGTDTPFMRIMLPAGGGANVLTALGIPFSTGLGFGITAGAADADTTAVAASQVLVNFFYD